MQATMLAPCPQSGNSSFVQVWTSFFSGGCGPWCLSWIGSVFDCRGSGGVGNWNCKCFAIFVLFVVVVVVVVVACCDCCGLRFHGVGGSTLICVFAGCGGGLVCWCVLRALLFLIRFINAVF